MALSLRSIAGKGAGLRLPLSGERLVIGRGAEADLVIDVIGASREHCEIRLAAGVATLTDLGSRNGTKVNGTRTEGERQLQNGDRIAIGTAEFLVCDDTHNGKPRLQIMAGKKVGSEYPLGSGTTSIGRSRQADVPLDDHGASRIHTQVIAEGNTFRVKDAGSRNGTLVNGDKLSGTGTLRSGDILQVGTTVLEFVDGRVEDLAGSVLAGCTLLRRVGLGSVGVVYRAKRLSDGEAVAVKVIDPAVAGDARLKALMVNGARQSARISDDHLQVVDDAVVADGQIAIVSDWASNGSLADLIPDQEGSEPPPAMIIAALAADAAQGLAAADQAGLPHRGLRPGNVLIGGDGMGRVADLATTAAYEAENSSGGTFPYYVSPEELTGQEADGIANQFSLGAICYHVLTGQPPFAGDRSEDVGTARFSGSLPAIGEFNQGVPKALTTWISRLLSVARVDRYPDWQSAIEDIKAILAKGDGAAVSPGSASAVAAGSNGPIPRRSPSAALGRGARSYKPASVEAEGRKLVPLAIIAVVLVVAILAVASINVGGSPGTPAASTGGGAGGTGNGTAVPGQTQPTVAQRTTPESIEEATGGGRWTGERTTVEAAAAQAMANQPGQNTPPEPAPATTPSDTPPAKPDVAISARPDESRPEPTTAQPVAQVDPDPAPVDTAAADPQPEPVSTPAQPAPTGLPRRNGPLTHFARPGQWEEGSLLLTDDRRLKGSFTADGDRFTFKAADGSEQLIEEYHIAAVDFVAPSNSKLRIADGYVRKKEFAKAVAKYEEAKEKLGDDPYLATVLHRAREADQRLQRAIGNITSGQIDGTPEIVMDGMLVYIELMEPRRLHKDLAQAWKEAWARLAGKVSAEQRADWQSAAKAVGVKLEYDENAPTYLAEALAAANSAEVDHRAVVKAFDKAIDGNAYLDDQARFLYALSLHKSGKSADASKILSSLSSTFRAREEVEALAMSLGLKPPTIKPEILVSTWIGKGGDQAINEVGFGSGNQVYAKGNGGFEVVYDLSTLNGRVSGDTSASMGAEAKYNTQPSHPKTTQSVTDKNGHTYSIVTKQVNALLQQPLLTSSAGWRYWGWSHSTVVNDTKGVRWGPLMADSRGYDVWLMPEGRIGVKCWTDGGNSVLTRHPQDLKKDNPIEGMGPMRASSGGMASMYMLLDPGEDGKNPKIVGGTFVRTHVTHQVVDQWGRVYIPKGIDTEKVAFGQQPGRGGLFVLGSDFLKPEYNARFGGSDAEVLGRIAIRDNILIMGGRTKSKDLFTKNAVQDKHGGGWDAWFVAIRLWRKD